MKARRQKALSNSTKKLTQKHRDNISKALKAYHAKRKGRKAVNDNLVGSTPARASSVTPVKSFRSRRQPMFQNRSLEAGHLKDLRKANAALKRALKTKRQNDAELGIRAQKRFQRKTKVRKFLARFLPSNMYRKGRSIQ